MMLFTAMPVAIFSKEAMATTLSSAAKVMTHFAVATEMIPTSSIRGMG